jgi:hypothetical protein
MAKHPSVLFSSNIFSGYYLFSHYWENRRKKKSNKQKATGNISHRLKNLSKGNCYAFVPVASGKIMTGNF